MVTDADTGNLCLTLGFYRLVQSTLGTFSSSSFPPPKAHDSANFAGKLREGAWAMDSL